MELKNLRAKKETEQRLREQQLDLEQVRDEIELRHQQEELRLQQQQQEQELRLKMQQQEDELRLRQLERELENKRKKAETDEEPKRMENELKNGSSRASGSQADDLENVGLRRNLERTAGWTNSVAQQFGPIQPLSPPENVTRGGGDKRFSAYPKPNSLFQAGAGLFSTQLQGSSILKKPEIPKPIRVTEPQTILLKRNF